MDSAAEIIRRLELEPHPEGGWYRETWRDLRADGERGSGTSILFLLEAGQRSHWHRIDAVELWLFQAGAPLQLSTATGPLTEEIRLGPDILAGDAPQAVVAAGQWQSARSLGAWSLAACVVVPAFDFAGFELAPPGWDPRGAPGSVLGLD